MSEETTKGIIGGDKMTTYKIRVDGCDDRTEFNMELTDDEAKTVQRLIDLCCKTSEYGCQPTMFMEVIK